MYAYCSTYKLSKYSTLLEDMQKDSDEEGVFEKAPKVELPFQEQWHNQKFEIKYRNAESIEDVKTVLASLEKDALLLNLIPIAFKDDLDREVQLTVCLLIL